MLSHETALQIIVLTLVIYSIVIHEVAHAIAAYWLGDDTAARLGRISLDPTRHVDPFMTLAVPAITFFLSGGHWAFGGAKPVPYNPARLRDQRWDPACIAFAGPVSNILIAVVLVAGLNLAPWLGQQNPVVARETVDVVLRVALINLFLAAFNLVPIPPLDGSKVVAGFLPRPMAAVYLGMGQQLGLFVVVGLSAMGMLDFIGAPVERFLHLLIDYLVYFR